MSSALFNAFGPDPDDLLRCLSRHVDDDMLEEIAAADYGHDIEQHLVQLRRIRDEGSFETPMDWHPIEVLELIRWSKPEDPKQQPSALGERGHWVRAFACAALLRASAAIEIRHLRNDLNEILIQLINGLCFLGSALDGPASAFLAWLILVFEPDPNAEEIDFLVVGLLWFGLRLRPAVPDEIIISLAEWVAVREQQTAQECGRYTGNLQLGSIYGSQSQEAWERLGDALCALDLGSRSVAAREWVVLIGSELAGRKRHVDVERST